eukprot:6199684-Pleurochrysis_carterae.AAC.3
MAPKKRLSDIKEAARQKYQSSPEGWRETHEPKVRMLFSIGLWRTLEVNLSNVSLHQRQRKRCTTSLEVDHIVLAFCTLPDLSEQVEFARSFIISRVHSVRVWPGGCSLVMTNPISVYQLAILNLLRFNRGAAKRAPQHRNGVATDKIALVPDAQFGRLSSASDEARTDWQKISHSMLLKSYRQDTSDGA